jgi:hypothetical protein
MDCYKKIGLLLCGMMLLMQGCVTNDLDDCPDAIRYALSFDYTVHADVYDRFYEDVDKMVVYAFDAATGLCVYADTATLLAPFEKDFTYSLPLNVGKYDIITWGWGRNTGDLTLKRSSTIIPNIIPGKTNIQDARFLLEEKLSDGRLEKNFYGELHDVEIPAFMSRVDTLRLVNLVNKIRVVLPDVNTAELQDKVEIYIKGDNGAYLFGGTPIVNPDKGVTYYAPNIDPARGSVTTLPYTIYRTDSILIADPIYRTEPYTGKGVGKDSLMVAEFSILRLVQNNENMKLVIKKNNNHSVELPLLDILQSGFAANVQYNLDKYDRWQLFFSAAESYVTVHIYVMDWHYIHMLEEIDM